MDKHTEEWRKSPLAPSHVEVSNLGRVRTLDRAAPIEHGAKKGLTQLRKGKVLSPWIGRSGYFCVSVKEGKTRKKYPVHRLIASAFCEGFDPSITVNHIDGNKLNNQSENLEWITTSENTSHQWRIGLVNLRGENHPNSKLTTRQVNELRTRVKNGERVSLLAEEFSVSVSIIYKISTRDRWASI